VINTFQDIVLTSPESAVSSILYSTMTLTFDFLTPNCDTKTERTRQKGRPKKIGGETVKSLVFTIRTLRTSINGNGESDGGIS